MHFITEQLFAGACLAQDQHCGISGRDDLYLLEHSFQRALSPMMSPKCCWVRIPSSR